MIGVLNQLWKYRTFILSSIRTEFKSKSIRSKLGSVWVVIYPLAQVLVYALILSNIMSAKFPEVSSKYAYAIYLLSGSIAWALFSELLSRFINIFIDNANFIKKLVFPKIVLPIIAIGVALINILIFLLCTIVILAILGFSPGVNIIWIPALIVITILFASSLGLILGVLNVFIRDIGQLVPIILQFWFWFTPIVYMRKIIPPHLMKFLAINPMVPIVESFQNVILLNKPPMFFQLGIVTGTSVLMFIIGGFLYKKASNEMVDML